jgi:vancomycin resistance protein YoaR
VSWVASFARPLTASLEFTVRADQLTAALLALEGEEASRVSEPTIVGTPGSVAIKGGVSGFSLDPDDVSGKLIKAAELDEDPITIATDPIERHPTISDDEARELAADLAGKTTRPLAVTAGYATAELPPATVRSWLRSRPGPEGLEATLNDEKVMADLQATFSEVKGEPVSARFDVVGGQVRVVPGQDGFTCCAADAPAKVLEAIEAGATTVQVPLDTTEPELTTAEAEELGIKEPVGAVTSFQGRPQIKSFTTYYACCEPRVRNIERMADLVRGAVIPPGETFSINDYVGERTLEKGFVPAGAIFEGKLVQEIGGGVSQFATTLFNAAFFAGLDFGEYQSHSLVFSRYPYGREATMGYPYPDLQLENTTPYGVLIWPTYTPTSITITLYSTQHVVGEQTGQSQAPMGRCTKVTTVRTRTYADGTKKTDEVFATYRPSEGVDC